MAFSSLKTHNDYDCSCPLEERDHHWLELGLGLGTAAATTTTTTCRKKENKFEQSSKVLGCATTTTTSSSSLQVQQLQARHEEIGHSLGLGLGIVEFDRNNTGGGSVRNKEVALAPRLSNHHKSRRMWQEDINQVQEDDDCNLDLTTRSSSSQAWPWKKVSSTTSCSSHEYYWQMPVPNGSHDCFLVSPPPPPPPQPAVPPPPPPSLPTTSTTRPHSAGLWFSLRSSVNRKGETLPQIPKAYVRVKDENVTVFMVKKYLVRKLGLSKEAEVEIWCMGQKLVDIQPLKLVRDCVWLPGLFESAVLHSTAISADHSSLNAPTSHHLMSLLYVPSCVLV